jgi:hypothetical protein
MPYAPQPMTKAAREATVYALVGAGMLISVYLILIYLIACWMTTNIYIQIFVLLLGKLNSLLPDTYKVRVSPSAYKVTPCLANWY